jgi:phosphate transport system substrate-binding protein
MTKQASDSVSRRKFLVGAGTAGTLALAGCTQSGGSAGDDESSGDGLSGAIDIAGSSTVFPLATAMSERFKEEHPGVDFSLQSTGSGGGFANYFCTGDTDFNNASRPIQEQELSQCEDSGVTPVELTVATDALTVIVNNEADWVDCLTVEELRQIWSAEDPPTLWSDVNSEWPDEEFALYGPTDASGTYDYFIEAIIGEEGPGHRQDYSATEQDRNIVQGVQGSETAMGYLGFAYYTENSDSVKALGVDDGDGCVEPSLETARTGEYTPLSRPLFTYPAKEALAEEHVAEFARFWIENATSTEIVADEVGYVPLSDEDQSAVMDTLETAIEEAGN